MNLNFTKKILLSLTLAIVCSFSISNLMAQCFGPTAPTPLDIRNIIKDISNCNGCTYLLALHDDDSADATAVSPGWDGATINVAINEGAFLPYKVTTQQNDCALIPLCVTDGGFIDLEYWNGAFEAEHGFTLYTADGNIAADVNGNLVDYIGSPAVGSLIRVKADCPAPACDGSTLDLELIPSFGNNNEPLFYEIRDGSGNILFSEGPVTSENLLGGSVTLNKCETYTIVFGSSAGVGASIVWDNARLSIIASEDEYNTRGPFNDISYMFNLLRPTLNANGMMMREFTIPCVPAEVDPINLLTNSGDCDFSGILPLELLEPEVCFNTCHVDCGSPAVSAEVFLDGALLTTYGYDYGVGIIPPVTPVSVILPAAKYTLTYIFTYNCEAVGIRVPNDLVQVKKEAEVLISSEANPTMACNPLVNITLGHDDENCETLITADMVLEDLDLCSEDEYEIVIEGTDGNYVTSAQACTTVKYTITHCYSGGTCWGYLNIEDKTNPTIACYDYDLPCNHPFADVVDYSATDTFCTANSVVTKEGLWVDAGFVSSNCAPEGEVIQEICLNLTLDHTRPRDLRVRLLTPFGTINLGRADNAPFCSSDLNSPLATLIGLSYAQAGSWTLSLRDNNSNNPPNDDPDAGIGYGKLLEACIDIQHGFPNPYDAFDCTLQYVTLLNEQLVETNCDQSNWVGAQIVRIYQAVDKPGNASTCVQTINLKAPAISDLEFPGDIHLECDGTSAADLQLADSGTFEFGCFDLDESHHNLCDISFAFSDVILPVCGDSYKILRSWTIINWCSNVTKLHSQTIFVEDTTGPEVPNGDITIDAAGYDCEGSVTLSDFGITDGCSDVTSVIATYYNANGQLNIVELVGGGLLEGLAFGSTVVEITATDGCYQTTTTTINVEVEDNTAPVAICDDDLHISLSTDGTARLDATAFDEGSSDNCELTSLEIKSLGCISGSFDTYADFSCCDLGTVRVELRVTDASGNTNICWADLLVEDPIAPLVVCKPDLTLTCDENYNDAFTEPEALDNCAVSLLSVVDGGSLDNCNAGVLTRTYTYTDGSDKSVDQSCTQSITVQHVSDFTIQFPQDVTINGCPDQIGATGEPLILDDDCELVSIGHEDQILTVVDDACYKIIRKWTVTNWCVNQSGVGTDLGIPLPLPNTFRDDDGYFYYEQIIKVLDDQAPTVTIAVGDPCDFSDGCEGAASVVATGADDCADLVDLVYHYRIDLFSDGTYDISGNGDDASGVYPYGDHKVEFTVSDGCGNGVVEAADFSIRDCKNPTPVCKHGLAIEVMNDGDGCAPIWANDFLEYAFDNCTTDAIVESSVLIRREGDTGTPQTSLEICCSDVPQGTVAIEVWVTDEAGNSDFCVSYIIAQDNLGNCPDSGNGTAMLSGDIVTEDYEDVEQVMVDVNYGSNSAPTGSNGTYTFPNLQVGNTFMVDPAKDINPLNGVSTYDLVLISQHILGVSPLASPYQLIAADVNNSGSVSTFDIVQLRQLILFVVTDFPNNESWRFVDMDYVFPVPTNPWAEAFPEEIYVNGLPANGELLADFFAIKIGDINGTAVPNNLLGSQSRSANETLLLSIEDREIEAGETFGLDFRASDFNNIVGYQFSLDFDKSAVEFVQTSAGKINTTDSNFGLTLLEEGVITTSVSHSSTFEVENNEVLFSLTFVAKQNTSISNVFDLNNRYTVAEAYNQSGELLDLGLKFNSQEGEIIVDGAAFDLFQNQPNPFKSSTSITFNLPTASKISLRIHDVSGKTVKLIEGDYDKGRNEILISKNELNATGVLFYTLETESDSATKKMIIID